MYRVKGKRGGSEDFEKQEGIYKGGLNERGVKNAQQMGQTLSAFVKPVRQLKARSSKARAVSFEENYWYR